MSVSLREGVDALIGMRGNNSSDIGLSPESTKALGEEMLDRSIVLSEFDTYIDSVVTGVNIDGTVSIGREAQKRELTTAVTNMGTMGIKGSVEQAQTAWRQ